MRTQSLQVTDEFKDVLDSLAEREGRSTSDMIRSVTELYADLAQNETIKKILDDTGMSLMDWFVYALDMAWVLGENKKLPAVNAMIYQIAKGKSA